MTRRAGAVPSGGFLDDFWWLLRGVAIGLAVAIPVGPIALLCMRRTLERGFLIGFGTGLGAAIADLIYASIAAFGISAVEEMLLEYRTSLSLIGGIFLLILAARTAAGKGVVESTKVPTAASAVTAFVSGFVLTATNPLTVLGFVAIFAGFGVGKGLTDTDRVLALVVGVTAGSILWWMTLNGIVARIRHLFEPKTLQRLNIAAGAIIAAFGFYELTIGIMRAAPYLF
jgi:threonine/homoserine/homoserine lactone efflux protein